MKTQFANLFQSFSINDCLNEGKFPHKWKKANVVPAHKKGNKDNLFSKISERLIYNKMLNFFTQNNVISPNRSEFRSGDSFVNQLLAITYKIYNSFDEGFELRGVFLDISKGFNKVWHEGLLIKIVFLEIF